MKKSEFEKYLERALGIYSFYPDNEKKIDRIREPSGYTIRSKNQNLIRDLARISNTTYIQEDKSAKVEIKITDWDK